MLKKDLLEKIKNVKDDEDINALLSGTDIEEGFKTSGITLDAFKGKLKEKEYKAFLESENDKYFNKALETWKTNNLEKELEPFISEKYPDLVTDPMQKQLLEVQKELATAKAEAIREKLLTQAMAYASEKKLPTSFVDKFLGEDLESTKANLDGFATDWSKGLEAIATEKMKQSSYVPGGSNPDGSKMSIGSLMAQKNSNEKSSAAPNLWGEDK